MVHWYSWSNSKFENLEGICGTPGYMAPEEYVSDSSPAGDLFADAWIVNVFLPNFSMFCGHVCLFLVCNTDSCWMLLDAVGIVCAFCNWHFQVSYPNLLIFGWCESGRYSTLQNLWFNQWIFVLRSWDGKLFICTPKAGVILYQLIRCNCPFHETVFRASWFRKVRGCNGKPCWMLYFPWDFHGFPWLYFRSLLFSPFSHLYMREKYPLPILSIAGQLWPCTPASLILLRSYVVDLWMR